MAEVDNLKRVTFSSRLGLKLQQMQSPLRSAFMFEPIDANQRFWDSYGRTTSYEKVDRHQDTIPVEITRQRRAISGRTFITPLIFDRDDQWRLATLAEPNNTIEQAVVAEHMRRETLVMIEAFDGTTMGGQTGATSFPFSATSPDWTASQDIAWDAFGTGADAGLTVEKIAAAVRVLRSKTQGLIQETIYGLAHTNQLIGLLTHGTNKAQVTNFDYAEVKSIVNGKPGSVFGVTWIPCNLVPTRVQAEGVEDSERYCFFWIKSGMAYGTYKSVDIEIDKLPLKSHSTLLTAYTTCAAARSWDDLVVRVNTKYDIAAVGATQSPII